MKAISVRQPEAWLIVNGLKDVENRNWATEHRGWLLIHASKHRMARDDWAYLRDTCRINGLPIPTEADVNLGGVVGMAWLQDCVTEDSSQWFDGPIGWILTNTQPLPFHPVNGRLSLFEIDGYEIDGDTLAIPETDE